MHHEERRLSRELVGHRSAWQERRFARVKKHCALLAMHRLFLVMLLPYRVMHRLFLAMLCLF
jgi:hypothetical protein